MRMPLYFFVIRKKKNTRKRRGRKRLSAERATRHPRREVGDPMILEKMSPLASQRTALPSVGDSDDAREDSGPPARGDSRWERRSRKVGHQNQAIAQSCIPIVHGR